MKALVALLVLGLAATTPRTRGCCTSAPGSSTKGPARRSRPPHRCRRPQQRGEGNLDDNQEGILAADNPSSNIVIDSSVFARNGAGDGFSHNIYINHVRSFTLRYSYSTDARVGHLVKSRALRNYIPYDRPTVRKAT